MAERYYAWDEPPLSRAEEHGCLDECVETGDPLVCANCAMTPAMQALSSRFRPADPSEEDRA